MPQAVLSEHGHVSNACVLFIVDDMRKASVNEGLEWGVFIGFGPGVTVETLVLHSVTIWKTVMLDLMTRFQDTKLIIKIRDGNF